MHIRHQRNPPSKNPGYRPVQCQNRAHMQAMAKQGLLSANVQLVIVAEDNLTWMVPHTRLICPTDLSSCLANCKPSLNTAWLVLHSLYVSLKPLLPSVCVKPVYTTLLVLYKFTDTVDTLTPVAYPGMSLPT